MSAYILPVLFVLLIGYAALKRVNIYNSFAEGAKDALILAANVFPYLAAIFIMVALFKESGLAGHFARIAGPFFNFFGIEPELSQLMFMRPLSGSGSTALLRDIYRDFGADSLIARQASVIVGAAETTFYITAVYFSTVKVKNLRYAIPVSILATFIGAVVGANIVRVM